MSYDPPEADKPETPDPRPLPVPPQALGYKRVLKRATAMNPFLARAVSEVAYEAGEAEKAEKRQEEREKEATVGRMMAQGIINAMSKDARSQVIALVRTRGRNRHTRRATEAIIRRDQRRQDRLSAKHKVRAEKKAARDVELQQRFCARHDRAEYRPLPGMPWSRYQQILDLKNGALLLDLKSDVHP